ncbi:GlxA family transcriptional regulator [Billgrantia lactosivorans]|uniref:GlxA family transcriptional regulator n=1 Tax=Billgrantia lactosivorans TaxID=2185141 RepID=UPI000DAE1BD6|nr:helix-turn-helix domain-containing protein [Halomonas lactosivorans]
MIDVTVVLVEGGMPSTAVAPVEVFSMAGVLWNSMRGKPVEPPFRVRTASQDGRRVSTAVDLSLEPSFALEDVEKTDLIVVSAVGADLDAACPANTALYPWLRKWHARGVTVAGVCAGVALLAEAGLLNGRTATTHWGVVEACRRRYPQVHWQPERFLTESDNVLCSGGVYAAVDLSLYLVEKLCGHRVAMETARALLLETPRVWQAGYAAEPPDATHEDRQIRRAQEWLFHHFTEPVRIEALADQVGMSSRNFIRRFKLATGETPTGYLHRLRVNAARHLLENEQQTIQQISRAVGYDDLAFFRRLFKRYTGLSPQRYRECFGQPHESIAIAGRAPHR